MIFSWIKHLLLCICSCTGQREKASLLLRRLEEESIWLNPIEMENDNDLDALRDLDEFNTLLKFSWDSYNCAVKNVQSKIYTIGRKDNVAPIYFFHGRGAKLTEFLEDFRDVFNCRQVYYVQSEQVYSRERYCWDDEQLSVLQVGNILGHSCESHKLISGVSQGGRTLINAFAQGIIKDDISCHVIKGMGHYILPQKIKRKMILEKL